MNSKTASRFLFLLLFLVGTSGSIAFAQPEEGLPDTPFEKAKSESRDQVFTMIQYSEDREYPKFSRMMAYTGRDERRAYSSYMKYEDPFESVEVENTANRLRHWVVKADGYELRKFRSVSGFGHTIYAWDVAFMKSNGKEKIHTLYFAPVDGFFMLCRLE